ncbi:MAG TPA: hypothetical protein VFO36_03600, partial [Nitrospiraceae bacterium]|nr:hypothetical protein [Nitrospiraceae bacterium]
MRLLDAPPAAKSMQPIFQFVMMPGQNEEKDKKSRQRAIAELTSTPFMKGNGDRQADGEGRESPMGKPFAEPPAPDIQAV